MPDITDPLASLQTPFMKGLNNFQPPSTGLSESIDPELGGWHQAFQDPQNNGGKTPDAIAASKVDDNPQDFRDLSININGLAYLTQKPSSDVGLNYEQEKQKFVKDQGWDMPKSEGEFRGMLGKHVETLANQSEALQAAKDQAVADDMEDASSNQSVSILARYAQWNTQHAGAFIGVPEATKMAAFTMQYGQARANLASPYNDLAKQIVDVFQNEQASKDLESRDKEAQGQAQNLANTALSTLGISGSFGDGSSTTAKDAGMPESHQDIVSKVNAVPREDLPKLKALIDQYARHNEKVNGDNKSSKYVVYKLAQSMERQAENMVVGSGRLISIAALNAQLATETDPAKIDAIKQKIAMKRSGAYLRSLVHNTVNPIQNQDNAVGGAEGLVQGIGAAIPYVASFGLGVGAGSILMVSSTISDVQERIAFNNPEVSDEALNLAAVTIGVPVGLLTLLGMGTISRAFPATEALFKTLPLDYPILNSLLHAGISTAAMTASNVVEEVGKKIAHALDSDFNDSNLAQELVATLKHAPSTFAVMMALGGIGHGKLSPEESDKLRASLKDPVSLKITGIDPSKMAGVSDSEVGAAYREAFKTRDAKAGEEFRLKIEELAKNAQQDPTIPQYKMDANGNHIITVLDPINGNIHELLNTPNAEEAADAHQAAFAMWRINILRHTFMTQDMQQRADKAAGIENRKYEFSLGYHLGLSLDAFKNGTAQEILRNRMQIADMPESSPLTDALVAGWSSTKPLNEDLVRDVNQYVSTIHNADFNPETQIHERADDWTARVLDSGKATLDQFKDWLTQTEQAVAARSGQEVTFLKNKENPTRTDIIEGVTEAALHLFGGHTADFASYPPELRGYFAAMGEYFKGVTEMGEHVKAAVDAGEVPKDFAEHLSTALGLPAETRLAPKSAETLADVVNPPLEAAGQPTFSVKPKNETTDPYKKRDGKDAGVPLTKTEIQEGIEDESGTLAEPEIDESKWDNTGTTFSIKAKQEPREGEVPLIDRSVLKGKKKFVYFSDRMRVGTYTGLDPESGINIPLQGGATYPFTEGNYQKDAGWAFSDPDMWTRFNNRVNDTDGVGVIALFSKGNVRGNATFLHAYFEEVKHAIKTGKLTEEDWLKEANAYKDAALNLAKRGGGKIGDGDGAWIPAWKEKWTSIEQAKQALADSTFEMRGSTFFGYDANKKGENKGSKIGNDSLVKKGFPNISKMIDLMEDPRWDGMDYGDLIGAVQFDKGQKAPESAESLGVREHMSYPVVIKGKGLGLFENPIHVNDIVQTDKTGFAAIRSASVKMSDVTFSIRSAEDRQKFYDEIDKRIYSDPEVYTPIWESMRNKVSKVQDALDAFAAMDSRDSNQTMEEKYREQGLIEINAVINALPKDVRTIFTRDWRNPYSGEQGNIFTKYSALTSDKERTDFLVKTIRKAKDVLDDTLVTEYSDRHQKLLDKAEPTFKAGKAPKGKLGADTHALLSDIQRYSHMDMAEVSSHDSALEAEKAKLENGEGVYSDEERQARIDKLDQQIWLLNTHGGMSPTNAEGNLKTAELRRNDLDRMAKAVEELKDIISEGRFDFNSEKKARSDQFKAIRQQVLDIVNNGKKGTPSKVQAAKDKAENGWGVGHLVDQMQRPTAIFRQILQNSPLADHFVRRIYEATHAEADANVKFKKQAIDTLRESWGKDGKLISRIAALRIIAKLSKTLPETGIYYYPNSEYKVSRIERDELPNYKGLIPDREYDNLIQLLSRDTKNAKGDWKIQKIDVHELVDKGDQEELKLSPLQLVDALMAADQPDAQKKIERNGLTPDVVDKIRNLVMTSEAKDVYQFARKAYDNYDRINEVFRKLYGVDLSRIENYSPLTFQTSDPDKIIDMEEGQAGGANSQPSWSKSRGNFGGTLRYDNAWSKLQNHMQNVNYWVSHAEMLRDFRSVFGDLSVLNAIGSKNADHKLFLQNFMKVMARDAMTTGNVQNLSNTMNRVWGGVMSIATLGGSIPTAVKHITVATAPLLEMPTHEFLLSALKVGSMTADRGAWFGKDAMIKDQSVKRFADASRAESGADALKAAKEFKSNLLTDLSIYGNEAGKMSMQGIHATVNTSAAWASAVRYDGAIREAKSLGITDPAEQHQYAQEKVDDMLHETMNPTFGIDKTISRWGATRPDWIQMFAGPAQQRLAKVIDIAKSAGIEASKQDNLAGKAGIHIDHAARLVVGGWLAAGAVEWLIHAAYTYLAGSDKQKEEVLDWHDLVATIAAGPVYGVPIVGPLLSTGIKSAITGHNPFYTSGNPYSELIGANKRVLKHIMDDEMTGKDYAELAKDASLTAGLVLAGLFRKTLAAKALASVAAWSNTGKAIAGVINNAEE